MKPLPAYRLLNLFALHATGLVSHILASAVSVAARVDAGQRRYHHRLGAWEAAASFRAAKLLEEQAEIRDRD